MKPQLLNTRLSFAEQLLVDLLDFFLDMSPFKEHHAKTMVKILKTRKDEQFPEVLKSLENETACAGFREFSESLTAGYLIEILPLFQKFPELNNDEAEYVQQFLQTVIDGGEIQALINSETQRRKRK